MLINERIRTIIISNRLSPSQFADEIGVKRSNLSHVLSGRNKPSLDFLSKILIAYPNVNAGWLITGETSEGKFEGDSSNAAKASKSKSVVVDSEIEKIVVFYTNGSFKEYAPSEL